MTERAWLIERSASISGSRASWWTGRSLTDFTFDAGKAVRFARREDAEAVRIGILKPVINGWRLAVTEHAWVGPD